MIWVNWQKLQCLNLLLLVARAQCVCVSPLSYCELFDECSGDAFWLVQLLGFIKSSANIKIALATLSSGWNKWNVCLFSKWWSSAFVMWKEDSEGLNWKEWKCLRASGCFIPLCPSVLIYSCTCQKKEAPMRCEYRSRNPPLLSVVGISSSPNEVLFCLSFFICFCYSGGSKCINQIGVFLMIFSVWAQTCQINCDTFVILWTSLRHNLYILISIYFSNIFTCCQCIHK